MTRSVGLVSFDSGPTNSPTGSLFFPEKKISFFVAFFSSLLDLFLVCILRFSSFFVFIPKPKTTSEDEESGGGSRKILRRLQVGWPMKEKC